MSCVICGNSSLSLFSINSKKIPIYSCKSCNVCFAEELEQKNSIKDRYAQGSFWRDTRYDIEEMIKTNFTNKEGIHFALNWYSMYSYCKKYLNNKNTILEIGVGTGVHSLMFDQKGFMVTGIEPDSHNVTYINQKLKNGYCYNTFFEDFNTIKKFDVIWLYHTLEHVIRPDFLLKRCNEWLKNDGIVVIAVPDCETKEYLQSSIENPDHLWHFSKKSLEKLSVNVGYKILKCQSLSLIKQLSIQRIYRIMNKTKMKYLSTKIWPYWPFKIVKENGYEIRLILTKL